MERKLDWSVGVQIRMYITKPKIWTGKKGDSGRQHGSENVDSDRVRSAPQKSIKTS